jgi:hypothetical protein
MRDRATILQTLERQRAELASRYRAFADDVVVQPCTASETEGGERWTPKDHLAHLLRVERAFLAMARATAQGGELPSVLGDGDRQSVLARVHRDNERHVAGLRERSVEELLAELDAARAETLSFLASIDDEQLDLVIPGAPWSDGTIGGVLLTNAHHEHQHLSWVDEGLAAST